MSVQRIITLLFPLLALLALDACGPQQTESWNSYYYGTQRRSVSGVVYDPAYAPADNDDSYVLPSGPWEDNQIPQGQKW